MSKSKTSVVGKTIVKSKEPFDRQRELNNRAIKRLVTKVNDKQGRPQMPPIAFICVADDGSIQTAGNKRLTQFFEKHREELIGLVVRPDREEPTHNSQGANTFNACGIPLTIGKKDYDEKRQIVSLIGNPPDENGKRGRNVWGLVKFRPTYWPEDIPFVNPSSANVKRDQTFTRCLHDDDMNKIIQAHVAAANQAVQSGQRIINMAPCDVDVAMADDECQGMDDEEESRHSRENSPVPTPSTGNPEPSTPPINEMDDKTKKLVEETFSKRQVAWMNELVGEILQQYSLWNGERRNINPQQLNARRLKKKGFPQGKFYLDQFTSLWEAASQNPTKLQVLGFCEYVAHAGHYINEYDRSGTLLSELQSTLGLTQTKNYEETVFTAAKTILMDGLDNPLMLTSFMAMAGALDALIVIHSEDGTTFIPPCICKHPEREIEFFLNSDGAYATLIDAAFVEGYKNMRSRKPRPSTLPTKRSYKEEMYDTPGVTANVLYRYKRTAIYQKDINTLMGKEWLSDAVIDCILSCEGKKSTVCVVASSIFAQKLLVSGNLLSRPLQLAGFNKEAAIYFPKSTGKAWILMPICNQIHWYLAAYQLAERKLYFLCSMGGTYRQEATGITRFLEEELEQNNVEVFYPEMSRQPNSFDCGVYVISFASYILKHGALPDATLVPRSREELFGFIKTNFKATKATKKTK